MIFVYIITILVYFFMHLHDKDDWCYDASGTSQGYSYGLRMWPHENTMLMNILTVVTYVPALQSNFVAQPVIPRFLKELQAPYFYRKKLVYFAMYISLITVALCFLLAGIFGSIIVGDHADSNLLIALSKCNNVWTDILFLLYSFVVIIGYPLVLYPMKASFIETIGF